MSLPPYVYSCEGFVPGKTRVQYSGPYWDNLEVDAAVKALTSGKWITSGEQVARFQNEFGRRFGTRHNHMVNSGSSANLVMVAALRKRYGWKTNNGVIVSPVGFPTTIAPIVQNGLWPFFADIEMGTLNFNLDEVEKLLLTAHQMKKRIVAIFVSPVLGNPPDMTRLLSLSARYGAVLVGDNCDSLGTKWNGRNWTDYCVASSTSFYAAHHLCTGEGGMVSSNDKDIVDFARSFSWWGRSCYCVGAANLLPCGTCKRRFSNWLGGDEIVDHKYVFENLGFNLKPLDLQGAIGLEQLKKFTEIETKRRANAVFIRGALAKVPGVRTATWAPQADVSWFGVPIICDTKEIRNALVTYLEANKIQTRSYFGGNILRHPGFKHLGNAADYPNAQEVFDRVFFLGCAPHYNQAVLSYIEGTINAWRKF